MATSPDIWGLQGTLQSSNVNRNTHRRAGCSSLWNMSRQSDASWLQGFHDSWLGGPGNQMQQTLLPPILYANDVRLLALPSAESCWFVVTHFIVSIWASFLFFPLCPHPTQLSQGVCQNFYKPAYTSLSEEDANHKTTENAGTQNL